MSIDRRLSKLEAVDAAQIDIDALARSLGLSDDAAAECRALAKEIPANAPPMECARFIAERTGIHAADIVAEAKHLLRLAEVMS